MSHKLVKALCIVYYSLFLREKNVFFSEELYLYYQWRVSAYLRISSVIVAAGRETQFFNTNGEIVLKPYNKYD